MLQLILKEMRVKQYTKNLLVFAAPLFAGQLGNLYILKETLMIFIAFCFTASLIYILNDIVDREKDKVHPTKSLRPIASGAFSLSKAVLLMIGLSACIVILLKNVPTAIFFVLGLYVFINIIYSWKLKHIVILDVMSIAAGFVLRAFSGALIVVGGITSWFMLCVFMLSLFLALSKRRHELVLFQYQVEKQRKVLPFYSIALIDQLLTITSAMTITSYALFAVQQEGITKSFDQIIITVPLVVYGIFRYLYLVHVKKLGGAPERVLMKDKHILLTVILYTVIIFCQRNL